MVVVIILLLIVVMIFGISSGMSSYASAQQSQALIEQAKATTAIAQVAEVNAWGNVMTVLALLAFIALVVAAISGLVYLRYRSRFPVQKAEGRRQMVELPGMSTAKQIEVMLQLEILEYFKSKREPQQSNLLDAPREDQNDPLHWLK